MKKLLLCALLLLGLLGLAQGLGHYQYQQQVSQWLTQLAQQQQWQLSRQIDNSNWWQQNETWQLQGDLQQLGLAPQAVNLVIQQRVTFWPLWLTGEWQFDPQQADYQALLQHYQLAPFAHQGRWQANIIRQRLTQQFKLEAFQQTLQQVELNVAPLQLNLTSDLAMQQGELNLDWQGMHLTDHQQQGDFISIGQIQLSERFTQHQQWTLVEQANWSVASLSFQLAEAHMSFDLQQLKVNNQFSEQQQKAYLGINGELGKLHFSEGEQHLTMEKLRLRSQLGGMPMDSLIQLSQLKQQQTQASALDPLVQQVVAAGLDWQLDQLAVNIDSNYSQTVLKGDLQLSGLAKLLPFELTEISKPLQLLRYLDLKLNIDVSDQLFSYSPLAGYILALRQAGYLEHQAGRDQSQLVFNDSEFSMNNIAVN
ncbi:hypothetical protein [Agarivorans sp. Z349TD_8]|uniref:hypothetical protein n=1 Tax=Agarivorans sp. Z349TD_8 TaxID=3421434 RepID=UPI003D7D4380